MSDAVNPRRILRNPAVLDRTGLGSKQHLYKLMAEGKFPKPVPLASRAVGWLESEVEQWIEEQVARRNAAIAQPGAAA